MKYSEIASYAGINAVDAGKVADLAESIKANGWQGAPILVCNMGLVTGSHRLAALAELDADLDYDGDALDQDVAEDVADEVNAYCEREGVGLTVMKGYAGGRLFSAEASPFGVAMTPTQCVHYALTRPAVASILAGFATPSHVADACAYEQATDEERDYASVLAGAPKHAYFGQCTYCGHCAPCPSGIDIALVNKFYDLATMQDEVPASVRAHYEALDAAGADCIACQSCEPRCPFGVPIAERMEKAAALFA